MSAPDEAKTLVITPTLNERANIDRLLPAIRAELPLADILVVDDDSPDGTADQVTAYAKHDPRVSLLHRRGMRGLGRAVLDGFRWALKKDYHRIIQMDADFSHPPRFLPRLLNAAARADLALGCRYIEGGGVLGWGAGRKWLSRMGNRYARQMLNLPFHDLTGGYKCFRRDLLEIIDLDAVRSTGYAFQIEMTWRAVRANASVVEVPILFPERQQGRSKLSLAIAHEAARNVWRMRKNRL